MRRSKIKPSINLGGVSRRSTVAKVDNKIKKTPPPKETSVSAKEIRTTGSPKVKNTPQVSKNTPEVTETQPVQARLQPPPTDPVPSKHESAETNQKEIKSTAQTPDVSVTAVTKTVQPATSNNAAEPSAAPPSQAKEISQRRRRISAKPNLGRMRLPLPSAPRKEKKTDTAQQKTSNIDATDSSPSCDVAKPSDPPPIRRVVESIKNTAVIPTLPAKVSSLQPNIRELPSTSAKPAPQASKPTVHPKAVLQPSRPDRLVEKRAALPPTIQDKRLRDLKALEAETPAKRRKRYIKKTAPPDRSKMTMSDLIYYNPKANPMKPVIMSKEKVKPIPDNNSSQDKSSAVNVDDEEAENESGTNPMAPQVRVDADGNIVIDKDSLTIEASPVRTFVAEDAEVVHEDSSNVTYASFRKRIHTTAWTKMETERFFMALSMVGTDFTMINVLFPKRTRHQIKNKFKREERNNRSRIDKAIREKMPLDKTLFETEDSDVESTEGNDDKKNGKKKGAKSKAFQNEDAEEAEFNEILLDNDFDQDDAADDVKFTNILAKPTRSGRVPKIRVLNSVDIEDDEEVITDGGIIRQIGSPIVNGTIQRTPSGSSVPTTTPGRITPKGTPTTPMQTVYVVTPLQGGKQLMISQHSIPQQSPDANLVQEQTEPSQFPAYSTPGQQSPVRHLKTSQQQQHSQTPLNSSTMQLRMPSPQNHMISPQRVTSPAGSHTVLTQRVGNTQIFVVSPATRGPVSQCQTNLRSTNSPGLVQQLTSPSQPSVAKGQNVSTDNQQTFIRIQPENNRISPNNAAIPQQNRTSSQTAKKKPNRTKEISLDEPFIPPSMKSKESTSSINNKQKVIVQNLPQSHHSTYSDGSLSKSQILLLDDESLAAQTEVVSDVAMEVEAEFTQ